MKRIMLYLVSLCLLLSLLAGCAAQPAPASEPAPADSTAGPETEAPASAASDTEAPEDGKKLRFSTTDLAGTEVTMEDYADAKLVLLNFWEPWCGPCVGEIPDLERLYETYQDKGLMILGVFNDMATEAKSLAEEHQISYPLLHNVDEFYPYMTSYVPTTVLFQGDGTLLSEEPLVGARSYDEWEEIILPYLGD